MAKFKGYNKYETAANDMYVAYMGYHNEYTIDFMGAFGDKYLERIPSMREPTKFVVFWGKFFAFYETINWDDDAAIDKFFDKELDYPWPNTRLY